MTERNAWRGFRPVLAAAAMLALAGCAATHVGEDWQCPIAQGSVCASVAAADPAVPEAPVPGTHRTQRLGAEAPLYRPGAEASGADEAGAARDAPGCDAGCGPLAWLRGLFAGLAGGTGAGAGEAEGPGRAGPAMAGDGGNDGASVSGPPDGTATAAEADAASDLQDAALPLPARGTEADPAQGEDEPGGAAAPGPAGGGPSDAGLRAPEVIGRVWIAPFVDADGIYREGSWVRVVIEPAAWRLP